MSDLFRNARLKVERAEAHINQLNRMINEFTASKNHEVFVEHDSHGGDDVLKVKAISLLPDEFAMALGDAIHNLRTALDYVMNEIEFLTVGKMTKYTKFPIYQSPKGLEGVVNGRFKEKAPKQVIDCIVEIVQPYITGDGEILCGLDDLDIADKHQLLIPKTEFNFISGIRFADDGGSECALDTWLLIPGKIASYQLRGCKNAKITNQGNASYKILFEQPSPFALHPFARQEIIWVMHCLVTLVKSSIREIERAYRQSQIYKSI
mgnify:CR=1 FL=1